MVGEPNELKSVTRVRFVPAMLLLGMAMVLVNPQVAGFYRKYEVPGGQDYAGHHQNYPQYSNPSYQGYAARSREPVFADVNYQDLEDLYRKQYQDVPRGGYGQAPRSSYDELSSVMRAQQMAEDPLTAGLINGIENQKLKNKMDADLDQLLGGPDVPDFLEGYVSRVAPPADEDNLRPQSDKKRVPEPLEIETEVKKVEEVEELEDPLAAKFPRLTLRQKQFAVNPSMPEYYQTNPNFLNFRLQELDESMRSGSEAGGQDGSGDSQDPQQILLGAKRARIGTASHLRWEDFAIENKNNDFFFTIAVAASTAFAICGVVGAGYCYHRRIRSWKDSEEVEYPSYGVTGPAKDVSPGSDRKLAQSAQIYHYQHQKNQMLGNNGTGLGQEESEGEESEGEEQEGDYTVYECPGLASTDEMEVKNPLFDYADPTPKP